MLRVIIADDENLICQMIVKMVDWAGLDMNVCGIAHDGLTVLRLIQTERPDIVITDIRMPGIDGLDMIQKAEEINKHVRFLIISGYRSFDYAHMAINLGVSHYLLKPIDHVELEDTLKQLYYEITKEQDEKNAIEELRYKSQNNKTQLRRHFLNDIIHKKNIHDNSHEFDNELSGTVEFSGQIFRAFIVKLDMPEVKDSSEILNILVCKVEQFMAKQSFEYVNSTLNTGIVSIVNYTSGQSDEIRNILLDLEKKLQYETGKFENCTVTIGVGTERNVIREVADSIEDAVTAVNCRIKKGRDCVIFYDELSYGLFPVDDFLNMERKIHISHIVEALDAQAIHEEVDGFSKYLKFHPNYHPKIVFDYVKCIEQIVKEVLTRNHVNEDIIMDFGKEIEKALDIEIDTNNILWSISTLCQRTFGKILEDRKQNTELPIRKAKAYMAEHFSENITLDTVANFVGWNAAYLSMQFKKSAGIGFSEYLTFLRIEKAKQMIKETDTPITQIAEAVGYFDYRYFSRIFKKNIGLKPSEYRKLYQ